MLLLSRTVAVERRMQGANKGLYTLAGSNHYRYSQLTSEVTAEEPDV